MPATRPSLATLVAVGILGCSIGGGVGAYAVLSTALLHPVMIGDDDGLFVLESRSRNVSAAVQGRRAHTYRAYASLRESGVCESSGAAGAEPFLVRSRNTAGYRNVQFSTPDLLRVMGVRPAAGREFFEGDDRTGAPLVAIVSHRFALQVAPAESAIGAELSVAGKSVTIVGVLPVGFVGPNLAQIPDVYMPLHSVANIVDAGPNYFADTGGSPVAWLRVYCRLELGQTPESLPDFGKKPNDSAGGPILSLTHVQRAAFPPAVRDDILRVSKLVAGMVAILVAIGYLTVGALLLLKTAARRDEFAIRHALGATHRRLTADVIREAGLWAICGTLVSIPVLELVLAGVRVVNLHGDLPAAVLDLPGTIERLGMSTVAGLGAWVVLSALASPVVLSLEGARVPFGLWATAGRGQMRARTILGVLQVAVALTLLSTAGVLARMIVASLDVNRASDMEHVATADVSLAAYGYDEARAREVFESIQDRMRNSASIQSVSFRSAGRLAMERLFVDGNYLSVPSPVEFSIVDENYLGTMGMDVIEGRNFGAGDAAGSRRVAVVSESLARVLGPGTPVGRRVRDIAGQPPQMVEVIGVVPDIVTNVKTPEALALYMPRAQEPAHPYRRQMVIRARRDTDVAIKEAIGTIALVDANVVEPRFTTLAEAIEDQLAPQRLALAVSGGLGTLAAVLAVCGSYIFAAATASMARRELLLRAALGARSSQLVYVVVRPVLGILVLGLAAGVVMIWWARLWLQAILFRTAPFDPTTIAVASGVLVLLVAVACWQTALKAARMNPAEMLRQA